jgi:hypothetical protein
MTSKLQALKREHPALQKIKFIYCFSGSFLTSWIRMHNTAHLCSVPVLLGLQLLVVFVKVCELLPHSQQLRLVGLQQLLHADDLLPILQLLLLQTINSLLLSLVPNSKRFFSKSCWSDGKKCASTPYQFSPLRARPYASLC